MTVRRFAILTRNVSEGFRQYLAHASGWYAGIDVSRSQMSEALRQKVLELYRDVDRDVQAAGPVCVASGRCCRFKEYGHVLFLSNLEADVLVSQAPPYEAPVSSDFCPFQQNNLCTAREPRPLGCRIYYC